MRDYYCEIIESITGRTVGILVGGLYAISNRLLENGFAPVDALGSLTGDWAKINRFEPELYAKFIEVKERGGFICAV